MSIDITKTRVLMEQKHGRPLIGCRFDPSGRYLFASSEDDTVQRIDLLTREKTAFVGHASWVRGMAFAAKPSPIVPAVPALALHGGLGAIRTPSPFVFLSGDYHGNLVWWNGADAAPKPTRSVAAHDGWIRAVAVSPDGDTVATCGNDQLVKLWSIADGRPLRTFEGHTSHVYNVAFHPGGTRLVSADLKGNVKDWDLSTGKVVRELDAKVFHKYDTGFGADIGGIRGIAFNAAGKHLACIGITNVSNAFAGVGNPLVVLFDWTDGKPKLLKPKDTYQGTGWGVNFLANGTIVGAGGAGQGRIWFWNPTDATNIHTANVPTNARDMALHPDGSALAIAGANGNCIVYSMTQAPAATPKK
jgi:WD40 repeat protein